MPAPAQLPDPFALLPVVPWEPRATRSLSVCGAPVELVWLPDRKLRTGAPSADRPSFRTDIAARIVNQEELWSDAEVTLTPNRFPFASPHGLLWTKQATREAPLSLLRTAIEMATAHGGSALANCIGAAASIPRAHVHLVRTRSTWLPELPVSPTAHAEVLAGLDDVTAADTRDVPFHAVRIAGEPAARARAAHRLLTQRMTAAFNLIDDGTHCWVFPRAEETPAPHFPYALGAAELHGQWCYGDREPFETATSADLERALALACRSH